MRIQKSEANYAQLIICGYSKENTYGIQLQLKQLDNKGYSRTDKDLYFSYENQGTIDEMLNIRDTFKNVVLSDKKIVHGQEVFTYKVNLEDALLKAQNMEMK